MEGDAEVEAAMQAPSGAGGSTADKGEYAALLEKGRGRDWSELESLHVLDVTGKDPVGRPVVVFVASRLPAKTLNMEDFLLFAIQKLDPVVRSDYVLVYVGSEVSSANRPTVAWLRRAYGLFSRNYKKVLFLFFFFFFFSLFVRSTFKSCILFIRRPSRV